MLGPVAPALFAPPRARLRHVVESLALPLALGSECASIPQLRTLLSRVQSQVFRDRGPVLRPPSGVVSGFVGRFGNPGGADPWVVEVLRFGYRIPFHVLPSLSAVPIPFPSYSPSSIRGIALNTAVADLLAKGAVEPAPSTPGYYSCLFVSHKVTGGWRPVIDLSRLNRSVLVPHFQMETAQSVLQSLRPGDWMVSLDLQDAYLQVTVHPSSWHYLWFCVGDSVHQFHSLCFSL